jgi:hypothetical protein
MKKHMRHMQKMLEFCLQMLMQNTWKYIHACKADYMYKKLWKWSVSICTYIESSPVTTEGKRIERNLNSPNLPKKLLGKGATTNNLELYEQKEKTQ